MASSITSPISLAAAESCLRRIPITPTRIRSTARIRTGGGRSLSALSRAAPPPSFEEGGGTYNLSYTTYKPEPPNPQVVGSSHGWLALFNPRDCNLFLWNPITSQTIDLPPLQTLPISKQNLTVSKVTLSCPPDHGECLAVMAFDSGRKLARCRPGRSASWTPFGGLRDAHDQGRLYPDFVYSSKHKLFFCLAEFDGVEGFDVEIWDLHNDSAVNSSVGIKPNLYETKKHEISREHSRQYLVYAEHSDQLFIVTRLLGNNKTDNTAGFDVHSVGFYDDKFGPRFLNPGVERKKLGYMEESLDGLVMFVGVSDSFALPAAEFPDLKPDSIYFNGGGGGGDIGIFDYQNKIMSPCYNSFDVDHPASAAPFWFTPYNSHAT